MFFSSPQNILGMAGWGKLFVMLLALFLPCQAQGLEVDEIVVLANGRLAESVELARFYMEQRQIPKKNLLLLETGSEEGCDRETYEKEIAAPTRAFLSGKPGISCLVLIYGLPLRIDGVMIADQNHPNRRRHDPVASVDSELSLVKVADYTIEGWLPNPYFNQFQKKKTRFSKGQVLMVARLDGPEPATVKRIITDSLVAERNGLSGSAYFDARWPRPPNEEQLLNGYRIYDRAIHQASEATAKVLATVVDDKEGLFQRGEAPQAALYCGWYSLGQYIDAFDWQQGAIAYHIASGECTTLKQEGSQVWCKRLLEDGVAATIGPVGEPYIQAFPFPQLFFSLLLDGDFTLVEAYQLSLPSISWKMVLIGDPLYRPFRQRGVLP
ncbi:MAG: TIGR03790 family protein [Thermodesulfobacteriota bacterium]